jgi:alpha-beta hydrolase superfamily lysophospholipase
VPKFTTVRSDDSFVDASGVTIHSYSWVVGKPKGIIQIAHGLGEHALRYEWLAQQLVDAGYSVYADDHRGHGATGVEQHGGDLAKLGRLGPGGLRATIAAIRQFTAIIRDANPAVPIVLLGQSWGSLMAQIIINEHSADYAAVVLAGTAHRSIGLMNGGDLNAKHKHLGPTRFEWLSRDPAVVSAFVEDPLTFYADVIKLFGIPDGLRLFGRPAKSIEPSIPVLIMIGSDDSLGGEKSVAKLADEYVTRSGLEDVKVIVYPGARHEVFNETNRDEVANDLTAWLDGHVDA